MLTLWCPQTMRTLPVCSDNSRISKFHVRWCASVSIWGLSDVFWSSYYMNETCIGIFMLFLYKKKCIMYPKSPSPSTVCPAAILVLPLCFFARKSNHSNLVPKLFIWFLSSRNCAEEICRPARESPTTRHVQKVCNHPLPFFAVWIWRNGWEELEIPT